MATTRIPKPLSRQLLIRGAEHFDKKGGNVMTLRVALDRFVKDAYDLAKISEKELLALHQHLSKHTARDSVLIFHLKP